MVLAPTVAEAIYLAVMAVQAAATAVAALLLEAAVVASLGKVMLVVLTLVLALAQVEAVRVQ
jgi:hypothetical protein